MIWVSYCVRPDGFRHQLVEEARRKRVRFFVSAYILDELQRTLTEDLGRGRRFAGLARRAVARVAKLVELPSFVPKHVPGDPNDDPIVQTALTSKADYLVTEDTEVLKLGKIRSTEVITASEFAFRLEADPKDRDEK
jgi:putative PIN family toxin of toxin-antitoxin system